jgi:hypothetical protein
MEAKFFSYKVDGMVLQPVDDYLKITKNFNRKELLDELKEILKKQNFKVDPASVEYKIVDDQLFILGMAVEEKEPKSIGFMGGK